MVVLLPGSDGKGIVAMSIKVQLQSWKRKSISIDELEKLLHTCSYDELYRLVSDAVTDGFLSPVKTSGINGNLMYPLFLKYRITIDIFGMDIARQIIVQITK